MDEGRLDAVNVEAARRLRAQGVAAEAPGGGLLRCRYARGGQVLIRTRVQPADEFDQELLLNRFATSLVTAAARRNRP